MSEHTINPLEKKVFVFAILFCLGMLGFIGFAVYKFGITVPGCVEDMKPFRESSLIKRADGHYEIHAVAKMWSFEPAQIDLPLGTTLDIFVTSIDVNHGFHIGGTNVNLSAVPGEINYARIQFKNPGTYQIVCHEYCGMGHQGMFGYIRVSDDILEPQIHAFLESSPAQPTSEPQTRDNSVDQEQVNKGKQLHAQKGCVACHSLDGSKMIGPTFKGLYGSKVELSDGSTVVADDAYLEESIREPQKKIVKGFEGLPMVTLPMTDDELKSLISLIKSVH